MDPLCELAQLGQRLGQLPLELFEQLLGLLEAVRILPVRPAARAKAPPAAVARRRESSARCGDVPRRWPRRGQARRRQLVARARARERKPDELAEGLQPPLGLERKGLAA